MQPDPSSLFAALVSEDGGAIDLAEAALLIAGGVPGPGGAAVPGAARPVGRERARAPARASDAHGGRDALRTVLFDEKGLRGNADDYYDRATASSTRSSTAAPASPSRSAPSTWRSAGARTSWWRAWPCPATSSCAWAAPRGRAAGPVLRRRVAVRAVPGAAGPRVRQGGGWTPACWPPATPRRSGPHAAQPEAHLRQARRPPACRAHLRPAAGPAGRPSSGATGA